MAVKAWKRVNVKLSEKADALLRQSLRRKGDLTRLFHEALTNTNWDEVEVVSRRKTYQVFMETSVGMTGEFYEKLKEYAQKRDVEVSALIDAILIAYYSR